MPQDQDDKGQAMVGRMYRGEAAPPVTTPEAIKSAQAAHATYAGKPNAVPIHVYFVGRGIDNPILQASMLAYTDVRVAPPEDFDEIFADHHEVPAPKPADGGKQ